MTISSPIRFGLAIRPPLYPGTAEQPPTLDVRQPLTLDVFQRQPIRFGAVVTSETGEKIQEWLALLAELGPNPPTDEQKRRINESAEILENLLSEDEPSTNHIVASIDLWGNNECNPYRNVVQNPEAVLLAQKISERQLQIMELASLGWKQALIGKALGISPQLLNTTLTGRRLSLYPKLGVQRMSQALTIVATCGLLLNPTPSENILLDRLKGIHLSQLEILELALSQRSPVGIVRILGLTEQAVNKEIGSLYRVLLPNQPGSRKALIAQYLPYINEIRELIEEKRAKVRK